MRFRVAVRIKGFVLFGMYSSHSVEVGFVRDWQVVPLRPLRSATAVFVVDTVRLEGGPLQNKMLGHWITSFLGFVELCLSLLL